MPKIRVEICLISARGLRRSSSLWKLQWFAVGWIDSDQKYCSKIDGSGSSNPTWKTKFAALIDESHPNLHGLSLHVEVYSREPIFLREKLHGIATVGLKEFFAKFAGNSDGLRSDVEEVGSFQLRKKKSGKPRGFVDVSVRVSEEGEGVSSYSGKEEGGFQLSDHKTNFSIPIESGPLPSYSTPQPYQPSNSGPLPSYPTARPYQPSNSGPLPSYPTARPYQPSIGRIENYPPTSFPYAQPTPYPANYSNQSAPGTSYRPPRTPPPPPPPSNVGFLPTFLPGAGQLPPDHYINMPSSNAAGRTGGPGFGMGVGAGALAAGAVIFGDDFMSGFDFPAGLQGGSLTISTDPPF